MNRFRKLSYNVTWDQAQFLEQECKRLEDVTGKRFSIGEVIQVLVEQHRVKMQMVADADPENVCWMHKWLADNPSKVL